MGGVGGALGWEPAGSAAVAEAEEEAAVAEGVVAAQVLARCQAYVVDGRTDSMVFEYTSKAAPSPSPSPSPSPNYLPWKAR